MARRLHISLLRMENCESQMNKLFAAAFIIVMIMLLSSVFVHISTDLMVQETVIKHDRPMNLLERKNGYR